MKIKQIEAILKRDKRIVVFNAPSCQWLSNGVAAYPAYNLPQLNKENILTFFDVAEGKRSNFHFEESELPTTLNFEDCDATEHILERGSMSIVTQGGVYEPLQTSQGITFIDTRYLKPLSDIADGYELYERTTANGRIYIVAKAGLMILGVIMPYELVNERFIDTLETWLRLSRVSLFNREQQATAERNEQYSFEEPAEEE